MNDITQLSTLYSKAIARAEKAEEALREAFTAGWRTNAISADNSNKAYLAGCEQADYDHFCKLGLQAYLDSLIPDDLASAPQPEVKVLKWMSDLEPFFAQGPFCRYRITSVDDDTGPHWQTDIAYQGSTYRRHETEAEAKAAAQTDYEQRILSALILPPPVRETP